MIPAGVQVFVALEPVDISAKASIDSRRRCGRSWAKILRAGLCSFFRTAERRG
jgi:hypothetical protein